MIWVGCIALLWGLAAVVPVTPDRLPAKALWFYYLASITGQVFALPLTLLVAIAATFFWGAAGAPLGLAALLFAVAHWRNWNAGRLLLRAVGRRDLSPPLLSGLTPFITGGGKVQRIKNLSYGEGGDANTLDIILPTSPIRQPLPILIHVHGGAWVHGAKDQQAKPLIHYMAAGGWMCVDINYRLGPTHRCPQMIEDVLRAIAWTKAHAHEYGGDPSRVAITGGSAGAHLAALAALAHDDPAFKPGFETIDCRVHAAVPLYGRYDFLDRRRRLKGNHDAVIEDFMAANVMPCAPAASPELWRAVSPLDRVRSGAPSMLIVHGAGDTMLPYQDAGDFAAALQSQNTDVVYVELPAVQHAFDMASTALTWGLVRAIEAFLAPLQNSSERFATTEAAA